MGLILKASSLRELLNFEPQLYESFVKTVASPDLLISQLFSEIFGHLAADSFKKIWLR